MGHAHARPLAGAALKPFDDRRLLASLSRAKQHLAAPAGARAAPLVELIAEREQERPYLERFVVRGREKTVLVGAREVDCLEAADDYVELHASGVVHVMRERLSDLEARLEPVS